MKTVAVEYIESGAFQGAEEDVFRADIDYGEECHVVKTADLKALQSAIKDYATALNEIASWSEGPTVTPSFDSPAAALTARNVLAKHGKQP